MEYRPESMDADAYFLASTRLRANGWEGVGDHWYRRETGSVYTLARATAISCARDLVAASWRKVRDSVLAFGRALGKALGRAARPLLDRIQDYKAEQACRRTRANYFQGPCGAHYCGDDPDWKVRAALKGRWPSLLGRESELWRLLAWRRMRHRKRELGERAALRAHVVRRASERMHEEEAAGGETW